MGLVARDTLPSRNNDHRGRPSQLRAQVTSLQRIRKRHKHMVAAQLETEVRSIDVPHHIYDRFLRDLDQSESFRGARDSR